MRTALIIAAAWLVFGFALCFAVGAVMGLGRRSRRPESAPPRLPVTDMPKQREPGQRARAHVWP